MPEEPQDKINDSNDTKVNNNQDQSIDEPNSDSYIDESSDEISKNIEDQLIESEASPTEEVSEDSFPESSTDLGSEVNPIGSPQTTPILSDAPNPMVAEKPKPRFSKKMISLVVAVAVVLLGGGSAFAALSWYQAPQKVLTDSLFNAIKSKSVIYTGDLSFSNKEYKLNLTMGGKGAKAVGDLSVDASLTVQGKDYKLSVSGMIVDSGDLYFKIGGIDAIAGQVETALGEAGASYIDSIDKLVAKINDKWIKVSNSDVAGLNKNYGDTQKCINTAIDKYKNDKKALNEVFSAYNKNEFIVINKELGQKDGSYGYELKGDDKALTLFINDLKETTIYKSLKDCDSNFEVNPQDFGADGSSNTTSNGVLEVWVDSWSHQINRVSIKGSDTADSSEFNATVKPVFDKDVTVSAPSDFMTVDDLKNYINDLLAV